MDLHFIHERGEGPNPKPLLLTHGWPGSFYEYHKLIPRLNSSIALWRVAGARLLGRRSFDARSWVLVLAEPTSLRPQ